MGKDASRRRSKENIGPISNTMKVLETIRWSPTGPDMWTTEEFTDEDQPEFGVARISDNEAANEQIAEAQQPESPMVL